jgi:hypothetical protein
MGRVVAAIGCHPSLSRGPVFGGGAFPGAGYREVKMLDDEMLREIFKKVNKINDDLVSIDTGFAEILRRIEAKLDRLTPLADMIEAAKDNPMLAQMLGLPDGN